MVKFHDRRDGMEHDIPGGSGFGEPHDYESNMMEPFFGKSHGHSDFSSDREDSESRNPYGETEDYETHANEPFYGNPYGKK